MVCCAISLANSNNEVTTCLERLAYIREKPQTDVTEAAFSYIENGLHLKT